MSDQETEGREQRSKIKLTRNAKGDPQFEISVVEGTSDETLTTIRRQAVQQWEKLHEELGIYDRSAA